MTKIIGIDPGLAETGIGIILGNDMNVEEYSYGTISTPKEHSISERLDKIFSTLLPIIKNEKPDFMVVEDIFSLKVNPKSGITLGKVSGVVLLAGSHANVKSMEISVREAKQVLTGNGNATKNQLEKSVRHVLNIKEPIRPFHISDALALALIGLYRYDSLITAAG